MHRKDRHAHIDRVEVVHRDLGSDGASSSGVDLAELAHLPGDLRILEDLPEVAHGLRSGVVGGIFATAAGVFGHDGPSSEV